MAAPEDSPRSRSRISTGRCSPALAMRSYGGSGGSGSYRGSCSTPSAATPGGGIYAGAGIDIGAGIGTGASVDTGALIDTGKRPDTGMGALMAGPRTRPYVRLIQLHLTSASHSHAKHAKK